MARSRGKACATAWLSLGLWWPLASCDDAATRSDQPVGPADVSAHGEAGSDDGHDRTTRGPDAASAGGNEHRDGNVALPTSAAADSGRPEHDSGSHGSRDAGSEDGGERSCAEQRQRADMMLANAVRVANDRCQVDEDCTLILASASCNTACTLASVSMRGAAELDAAVRDVELEACEPSTQLGCPPVEPTPCNDAYLAPRCIQWTCQAEVSGCPEQVQELEGKPCTEPGKECFDSGWCPLGMMCAYKENSSELRWEPVILLCSGRFP